MRADLPADFLTEMARDGSEPFLTQIVGGTPGPLYISDRTVTIGGNVYEVLMPPDGWGTFESLITGSALQPALDIGAMDAKMTNQPVIVAAALAGRRLVELIGPTFGTRPATVNLNFRKPDGTYTSAPLFAGYLRTPIRWAQDRINWRIVSMRDYYCSRSALKVFDDATFEWMAREDIGSTLPMVFGPAKRSPGRVIKRGPISSPVAALTNVSTASLEVAICTPIAGTETWTLTFQAPETVAFTGTGNTNNVLGASTTPRAVYAQSFQTVGAQTLLALYLRLKFDGWTNQPITSQVMVHICADAAGVPGGVLASGTAFVPNTAQSYVDIGVGLWSSVALAAATPYWIVVRRWGTSTWAFRWQSASAGGYAGGHGKAGTFSASHESTLLATYTWGTDPAGNSRDAHDFLFSLIFASGIAPSYSIAGSVTGADGTGFLGSNSFSTSGKVFIPSAGWRGVPASGDVFRFKTDQTYQSITLFGQANATNLSANSWLERVWWGDEPIGLQGASAVSLTGADMTLEIGPTTIGIGQTYRFTAGAVLKKVWFRLKKTGSPVSSLWLSVFETDATGTVPQSGAAPLATINLAASAVTTSFALVPFDFTLSPVLLKGGKSYAFVLTDLISTAGNSYTVSYDASGPYTAPNQLCFKTRTADWTSYVNDQMHMQIDLATWRPAHAGPDLTPYGWNAANGVPVLYADADVAIPSDVAIAGDLTAGVVDDAGTITGIAGSSVTMPNHVFHWLLRAAGVPDANIDLDGSFADAGGRFGSVYRFVGVVQDQQTFAELFLKLQRECRCSFDWPVDKAQLNFLKNSSEPVAATLTPANIVADAETGILLLEFEWGDSKGVTNSIDVRWGRDPHLPAEDPRSYLRHTHREEGASIVLYGRLEVPEASFYDFVATEPMAIALAEYALLRKAMPKRIGSVVVKLPHLALQKADSIAIAA
jgi:hypothetical protein